MQNYLCKHSIAIHSGNHHWYTHKDKIKDDQHARNHRLLQRKMSLNPMLEVIIHNEIKSKLHTLVQNMLKQSRFSKFIRVIWKTCNIDLKKKPAIVLFRKIF